MSGARNNHTSNQFNGCSGRTDCNGGTKPNGTRTNGNGRSSRVSIGKVLVSVGEVRNSDLCQVP